MTTTNTPRGYGYARSVEMRFDEAVERTKAALKEQGFGVLAEIDIRRAMKEKLELNVAPHLILGACKPQLARSRTTVADPAARQRRLPRSYVVASSAGRNSSTRHPAAARACAAS
jgi:uncharacterized protein (DUF302 family)